MRTRLAQLSYALRQGELISLESGAGWEVSCQHGHVWLTLSGRGQDIWLSAGQRMILPDQTKVVIEAIASQGASHVRLDQCTGATAMPRSAVTPRLCAVPERRSVHWLGRLRRTLASLVPIRAA